MGPPKSSVWQYFTKNDEKTASCKKCFKTVRFCGNTSNLHKHLKSHPDYIAPVNDNDKISMRKKKETDHIAEVKSLNKEIVPVTPEASTSTSTKSYSDLNLMPSDNTLKCMFENITSQKKGGIKYNNINMCILYFICKDMRPFNVVEGEGFLKLMKELAPYYKVPSSTHFKKLLCDKYDIVKMQYVSRISNATELCVTLDIWTETMNEKSFLGVTVHFLEKTALTSSNIATRELQSNHTAEYIFDVFGDILKDWDIPLSKVICAVTDNGANMVAAIKKSLGDAKHLPCFAHTINLIVHSSLKNTSSVITSIINKVRDIVKWVKNSVIQSDKLRKIQIDSGVPEGCTKKFILDVNTRWNSLYYMVDRFLDMSKIAAQLLLDATDSPELVTGQEIGILKQLIPLLQPLEFVTRESSGQNYVTLSKIIPMINCLTSQLTKFSSSIDCVTELQTKVLAECKKRFGLIEFNTLAALATILDPRFKNLHFQDPNACGRAIQKLKNIIAEDLTMSTSGSEDETVNEDFDFWSHHKQLAVGQKRRRASSKADEVSIYLANPVCALKTSPLEEWEDLKPVFPALYKQARIYLNIVGTSVPCERLFSKAGGTVTAARNRLTGKHLEKLIFLGSATKTDFFRKLLTFCTYQ